MLKSHTEVLEQALEIISTMTVEEYQQVLSPHFSGSIGQHIRHIIDHYLALEQGALLGHVDYNQRHRASNIERCKQEATAAIQAIVTWLHGLEPSALGRQIVIESEVSVIGTQSEQGVSTLGREIMFVSSHAIHHYSLIAIIRSLQGGVVPELFGYAPATISYINHRET
ncbi:DinB family protein [Alteromonas flava]|uniref:DinB family protein n=1 Tax=Alteromonas flava TaxID=2048003 RepID=UPI000C28EEE6|nr:DinB family protein [Alteromonas flava]